MKSGDTLYSNQPLRASQHLVRKTHFLKVNSMQTHAETTRNSTRALTEDKICPTLES